MTREQAMEIWEGMYNDELVTEYNHYVSNVLNNSDLEIWEMDCLYDLIENVPPMDIVKMIAYGEVDIRDEYFAFDIYGNLQTISKDNLFDYVIDRIDCGHIIDVAKEYEEEEEDD